MAILEAINWMNQRAVIDRLLADAERADKMNNGIKPRQHKGKSVKMPNRKGR